MLNFQKSCYKEHFDSLYYSESDPVSSDERNKKEKKLKAEIST